MTKEACPFLGDLLHERGRHALVRVDLQDAAPRDLVAALALLELGERLSEARRPAGLAAADLVKGNFWFEYMPAGVNNCKSNEMNSG